MNGKSDLSDVLQAERTPESEFAQVMDNDPTKRQGDMNDVTKHSANVSWGLIEPRSSSFGLRWRRS